MAGIRVGAVTRTRMRLFRLSGLPTRAMYEQPRNVIDAGRLSFATALAFLVPATVWADRLQDEDDSSKPPPPGSSRQVHPLMVSAPPDIDGLLDDAVWAEAPVTDGFWMTSEKRWPDERTEVRVVMDQDKLYFAFHAYDSQPDAVSAIEAVRDRGLGFDDQVVIEIDAFGDHEGISRFSVNARGTQDGAIAGGRASQIAWKGLWDASVRRTGDGWTAEIAIPFQILNYRPGTEEFAVNFARYHHRTRQWSRWADVTPQDKKEEMGRLVGLEPPRREGLNNWTFMPYVLAGSNIVDRKGDFHEYLVTGGLDIRYAPRSSLTGVLSLYPDFTQVETQITDANFAYNEKRVRDPRVFFVEGADYFGKDKRTFYSPRVPDFNAGAKVFGQNGALRYSSFVTSSSDSRFDGLARLAFAADATHTGHVTFIGTDQERLDGTTIALGMEGREKIGSIWNVDFIHTDNDFSQQDPQDSQDPQGQQAGNMLDISAGWQGDYVSAGVQYDDYDKEFLPANGLIKTDRLGTTGASAFGSHYRTFGASGISETSFDVVRSYRETDDGRTQNDNWYAGGSLEWNQFMRTSLSYSDGDYRPTTGVAPGDSSDDVNRDRFWTAGIEFNTRSSRLGYGASYSSGELGGGDYEYAIAYFWTRPTYQTSLGFTAERLDSFGLFEQYVVEAGWDLNATNSLVFRHINSGGDQFWRIGFRHVATQGIDIFALFDEIPGNDAELSVKLRWTL